MSTRLRISFLALAMLVHSTSFSATQSETCLGYLTVLKKQHATDSLTRQQNEVALSAFSYFINNRLGHVDGQPHYRSVEAVNPVQARIFRKTVAGRVEGILSDFSSRELGQGNQIEFVGSVFEGKENILGFLSEAKEEADRLQRVRRQFLKNLYPTMAVGAIADAFFLSELALSLGTLDPMVLPFVFLKMAMINAVFPGDLLFAEIYLKDQASRLFVEEVELMLDRGFSSQEFSFLGDQRKILKNLDHQIKIGVHEQHGLFDQHVLESYSVTKYVLLLLRAILKEKTVKFFYQRDLLLTINPATGEPQLVVLFRIRKNLPQFPAPVGQKEKLDQKIFLPELLSDQT